MNKGTVIYFSHGGGPMPILGDPGHKEMISFMQQLPDRFPLPDEILVISAHWEADSPSILNKAQHSLLYDYYGFPEESYNLRYPAAGNYELAEEVKALLDAGGISAAITDERGLDHGVFIPLLMMYPNADIPVIQLSLIKGLNPEAHIDMGKALRSLMNRNILVIGSGFSFHNMSAFFSGPGKGDDLRNDEFQNWLIDVCSGQHTSKQREKLLLRWMDAPHARYCHPREEHLLPLHVCYGISGAGGEVVFDSEIAGKRAVAFEWKEI